MKVLPRDFRTVVSVELPIALKTRLPYYIQHLRDTALGGKQLIRCDILLKWKGKVRICRPRMQTDADAFKPSQSSSFEVARLIQVHLFNSTLVVFVNMFMADLLIR